MAKRPELLLPVGDPEMAQAAIHNGADAIYVGFPGFNARGRTVDFSIEDLRLLIETCHLYGVKVNVALNILIFENELSKVAALLKEILPLKPDAFIVQDIGLIVLIRKLAPHQVIHASTQMTITNHDAIVLLNDLNIRRFVLARENSLKEIKLIKQKTNEELEVFVQGALCVSYSGQCLTSESIGGRSANRGQCAQSCRFSYDLLLDGRKLDLSAGKSYLLSPKDLCGLKEIPELIDLGVSSFKVEGRLKSPQYVAECARQYRRAIETHLANKQFSEQDYTLARRKLASTYSRGFYSGWLNGVNHQDLVDGTYSSHRGQRIGKILSVKPGLLIVQIDPEYAPKAGDGILWSYRKNDTSVEDGAKIYHSQKLSMGKWELSFANDKLLSDEASGAELYLNSDSELTKELTKSYTDKDLKKRIPVAIVVQLEVDKHLRATLSDGRFTVQAQTQSPLQTAKSQGLSDEFIRNEISSLGGTVFMANEIEVIRKDSTPVFCHHKEIKVLRRSLTAQLAELRSKNTVEWTPNQIKSPGTKDIQEILQAQLQDSEDLGALTKLNVLLREKEQVEDFVQAWGRGEVNQDLLDFIILDFEFGRDFATSAELLKAHKIRCAIATTRILKPMEYINLRNIQSISPDAILIRNLGALHYFTEISPFAGDLIGDFSLNVTNHLTAQYLLGKGLSRVCASYDLSHTQVDELLMHAQAKTMEVTVHQYTPSFHMEHCVFAAFLSTGSSFVDCGKPCEKHQIELRDQFGNSHQIKADQECRNTMYSAVATSAARYIPQWQKLGLGRIRFEALRERGEDLIQKIQSYQRLLAGEIMPNDLLSTLRLKENYGLGEGNFARERKYQDRKKTPKGLQGSSLS